jgi:hypothetical protein
MASHNVPIELASAIQSASIQRHPSPRHDLNPSTAASAKRPIEVDPNTDDIDDSEVDEDEVPASVLRPLPRRQTMPPLPDMRFEQSYLKSIENADGWMGVGWITFRDQVGITVLAAAFVYIES